MLRRDFEDRDVASKANVMIVNDTFARHFGDADVWLMEVRR